MTLVQLPTITSTINQQYFIEALTGSQQPTSYLDRFPDTVYTKAIDSLLVKFLYALMGPVGVGSLRQEYLEARLQLEMAGLQGTDLDNFYSNAFAIARLAEETYEVDASASLLPAAQRAEILAQDANFRNRAIDFLKGARAGGTVLGIKLAAKSGLNRPVDIIENYRALYDQYSDLPLGLQNFGSTTSPHEVIVVPRQTTPQSAVQTLTITGEPWRGWFTLTYPVGQTWNLVPVTTVADSNVLTVADSSLFTQGAFVTLTSLESWVPSDILTPLDITLFAEVGSVPDSTTVEMVYPLTAGTNAGSPVGAPTSGNVLALVGYCETTPLPYNATADQVQEALSGLPVIGAGNISCSGGPLPSDSITITFVNNLSDQPVETIQANTEPAIEVGITETGSGGTEEMSDANDSPFTIAASVSQTTGGVAASNQQTTIAAADLHAMRDAVDQLRPLTTLITTQNAAPTTTPQPANTNFTNSSQFQVLRYETGRGSVQWPTLDATHWIQAGIEHEAPQAVNANSQNYQGFHNVSNTVAYTEVALTDTGYPTGTYTVTNYWDSLIGQFSQAQLTLCPGLNAYVSKTAQFLPPNAIASQPYPLVISTVGGQSVINGIYPIDYYSLPGITIPTGTAIWASQERMVGTDYLEIDLGTTQAVNYLYFEATRKPFTISVSYDALDQAPARNFQPITLTPSSLNQSTTTLTYDTTKTNLWLDCEISFTNALGGMIYTRFIRLAFTRTPANTPFQSNLGAIIPYSIEVRNLRIGRNVSTPNSGVARFVSAPTTSATTAATTT